MRILVLASETAPALSLVAALESHAYAVDRVSPSDPSWEAEHMDYPVVILDLDAAPLAAGNGLPVLRRLRRNGWSGCLLALKTSSTVADRVAALNAGADEFLAEPVDVDELAACIEALMRRGGLYSTALCVGDLELDPVKRSVRRANRTIALTPREFDLLEFLVRNRERPHTRASIVRHVWNHRFDGLTNLVDVYIAYLRRKIDDGFASKLIWTARGVGYVVKDPGARKQPPVASAQPTFIRGRES